MQRRLPRRIPERLLADQISVGGGLSSTSQYLLISRAAYTRAACVLMHARIGYGGIVKGASDEENLGDLAHGVDARGGLEGLVEATANHFRGNESRGRKDEPPLLTITIVQESSCLVNQTGNRQLIVKAINSAVKYVRACIQWVSNQSQRGPPFPARSATELMSAPVCDVVTYVTHVAAALGGLTRARTLVKECSTDIIYVLRVKMKARIDDDLEEATSTYFPITLTIFHSLFQKTLLKLHEEASRDYD
ncbi:hypothetical protein EAG_05705 [Camponotus floridanus]|uniref:Uncharacterized protein n=1 Tax=Camponotus floridanus TaxID=104421 RepID=E2AVM9_CAMFO|nr:hypothetical protein EAG_05705 [Camponotus floridanus]